MKKKFKWLGTETLGGRMPKEMDKLDFENSLSLNKSFEKKKMFDGEVAIPIITKIVWYKKGL